MCYLQIVIYFYSFYVADQDMARYSLCSAEKKCVSLAAPYPTVCAGAPGTRVSLLDKFVHL